MQNTPHAGANIMNQSTDLVKRYQLVSTTDGPNVLLLAGVHGDEYEPMVAALRIVKKLDGQLLKGSITVVPNANPTAYEAVSRYGNDGLDMARICPGTKNGTSSDKAADEVSTLIQNCNYLVDMHTGGVMYDIYPLAGYMLHPDQSVLDLQRQMAFCYSLPVVWGTDPLPEGRTLSIARDAGVPAIYLEYGGGTGFRPQVVDAYEHGFINLLKWLQMLPGDHLPAAPEKTFWVEDARQDSGFLQGKMPAPTAGIFVSEAVLGQQVRKGDLWGKIINPETNETTEIRTDIDGIAFLMRNIVKVKQGDALGGILPITAPGKVSVDQ